MAHLMRKDNGLPAYASMHLMKRGARPSEGIENIELGNRITKNKCNFKVWMGMHSVHESYRVMGQSHGSSRAMAGGTRKLDGKLTIVRDEST